MGGGLFILLANFKSYKSKKVFIYGQIFLRLFKHRINKISSVEFIVRFYF